MNLFPAEVGLLEPPDNRRVVNLGDSFDGSEAHAIDVHLQAQLSYVVAVAPMRLGIGDELASTIPTAVVLLSMSETVL